jgi:aspartate/glutamate racemase
MHKLADAVEKKTAILLLHIADSTAEVLLQDNIKKMAFWELPIPWNRPFTKTSS